jgi:KDO2-lipid IV(A) lauroyltransferase
VFQEYLSSYEKKRLAAGYYSHMMLCVKELFLFSLLGKKRLEKRIKVIGLEHLHNAINKEKGVIVFTGHFGNWEFVSLFSEKMKIKKQRLYCIRKSLRFDFLNTFFLRRFEKAGFTIIDKKNAVHYVRSALQNNGVVFFPFDLRPSNHAKDKCEVDFLGHNTSSYTSLAYVVDRYKSPVLSVTFYRVNKKQHVVEFCPEIEWVPHEDKGQAILTNTKRYNRRMEDMLLAHPEQWIWSYTRW